MTILPDLPSALIRLALADLAVVEEHPETYTVDMLIYHSSSFAGNRCHVCLAGAVMANTLKADPRQNVVTSQYHEHQYKLFALNDFRLGYLASGLILMGRDTGDNTVVYTFPVTEYSEDPAAFRHDMEAMAAYLEKKGH